MQTRDRLRHLVDELPESELHTAERFLEYLAGGIPMPRTLAEAPEDDEPETREEAEAVAEAYEERAAGELISHDEVRQRLLRQR